MNTKESKFRNTWKKVRLNTPAYVMLLPFMILFVTFVLVPVLGSVVLSFTNFNMLQMPEFVGVTNYIRLFLEDDVFMKALQNTLLFAVITGPLGFLLSFLVAWFINELKPKLRSIITLIMYAPSLAGNVYYIWKFMFAGDSKGLVNSFLIQVGIIRDPILWLTDTKFNFTISILLMLWLSLGTGFLSFVAGLQSLDRTYFEASAIDGVRNRWQELWFVTLPQMGPQLLFGAVMTISGAFAVGTQISGLTGFPSTNYSTHTILLHMMDYGTIRFEMGYASCIAVVLFGLMLLTWYFINRFLRRYSHD